MIPPGWNVTEPLQVAKEFVVFVREFRGAPQEIKVFASTLDGFSGALKQLDKRLRHPDLVPAEEYDGLKSAFIDCMHCAESCQNFINQFNQDVRVPVSAGHKLKWIWKKDQSLALERSMASKISIITMHLNVAAM